MKTKQFLSLFLEDTENKPSTSQKQDQLLWAFVQTTPEVVHELSADAMPRVKLTGSGKMPVVDMRKSQISTGNQMASGQVASGQMASGQLASGHPTVSGLPPKSPMYAIVNKAAKKKSPTTNNPSPKKQPPHLHNYCNVSPLLGDVINKKPELFQQVQPNQVFACLNKNEDNKTTKQDNYLQMTPAACSVPDDQLPLRPFEPLDYRNRKINVDDEPVDPISLRLQVKNILKK